MEKNEIVTKIRGLLGNNQTVIVGIDGLGGSGKSTLAQYIQTNISNTTIVQMDDFYSSDLGRADRSRIEKEVLVPLSQNLACSYQIYDWRNNKLINGPSIQTGGLVIIEGVFAIHPQLAPYYNYKIWIDCPPEIGFKRGIERDKITDGVDNTEKWQTIWMPDEKKYFETEKPNLYADCILNNY